MELDNDARLKKRTLFSCPMKSSQMTQSIGNWAQTFTNVEFPLASSLEAINKGDQDDLLCSTGRWRSKIGSLHYR